jgi:hypothetical protein
MKRRESAASVEMAAVLDETNDRLADEVRVLALHNHPPSPPPPPPQRLPLM